ncbi:MAG: tetratricopeptide repeat protein [Abditibacteriales bacterium]|nr:tetratricopeptide repeat protein [Abditibacteriales bacterium]MDW8365382.1 tetratricopeptide repeat protein [Abditibacteriales bacterium]
MSLVDSETAKQMCEDAKHALARGEADSAIGRLQQALIFHPRSADAKMLLGIAYAQKGMMDEALDALEEAVSVSERNPVVHFNYGSVLMKVGRVLEAITQFEEALRINPAYDKAKAALEAAKKQWGEQMYMPPSTARPHAPTSHKEEAATTKHGGWFGWGKKK